MSKALKGIILFSAVEILTMVLWLYFANRGNILGVIILAGGLLVEHYAALNIGNGRRAFGPLPPD